MGCSLYLKSFSLVFQTEMILAFILYPLLHCTFQYYRSPNRTLMLLEQKFVISRSFHVQGLGLSLQESSFSVSIPALYMYFSLKVTVRSKQQERGVNSTSLKCSSTTLTLCHTYTESSDHFIQSERQNGPRCILPLIFNEPPALKNCPPAFSFPCPGNKQ